MTFTVFTVNTVNTVNAQTLKTMKMIYIPKDTIKPAYGSIIPFLLDTVGVHHTDALVERYRLGCAPTDGADIFWRLDAGGNPTGASVILHDGRGNVLRAWPTIPRNPALNGIYATRPCLFGRHLLRDGDAVAIVPDEVSALLGSVAEPRLKWMAVGYGQNLTEGLLAQLAGHDVVLFPDSLNAEPWHRLPMPTKRIAVSDAFAAGGLNRTLIDNVRKSAPFTNK